MVRNNRNLELTETVFYTHRFRVSESRVQGHAGGVTHISSFWNWKKKSSFVNSTILKIEPAFITRENSIFRCGSDVQ